MGSGPVVSGVPLVQTVHFLLGRPDVGPRGVPDAAHFLVGQLLVRVVGQRAKVVVAFLQQDGHEVGNGAREDVVERLLDLGGRLRVLDVLQLVVAGVAEDHLVDHRIRRASFQGLPGAHDAGEAGDAEALDVHVLLHADFQGVQEPVGVGLGEIALDDEEVALGVPARQ